MRIPIVLFLLLDKITSQRSTIVFIDLNTHVANPQKSGDKEFVVEVLLKINY